MRNLLLLILVLGSCSSKPSLSDPSIDASEGSIDPNVENGTAFDRGSIDIGSTRQVVLPESAEVRRGDKTGKVKLFLAKRLAFAGHPGKRISVRDARREMGCGIKLVDGSLTIATFGEWDSHIEGGASIKLVVVVPDGIPVKTQSGLSGESSAAMQSRGGIALTESTTSPGGYWYGPTSHEKGWTAIPTVPDQERTAR